MTACVVWAVIFSLLTDTFVCATMLVQKLLYHYATTCQKLCQLEKFRERLQEVFIAVDFGRKLKDMRAAEQLTQHELGQQIGVSTAAIQSWERNLRAPGMEHLVRLSRAFHTSIDDMLGLEFNKNQDMLSGSERMFLSRYRMLDEYGQRAVQSICDIEHERTTAAQTHKTSSIVIDFGKELGKRIPYFSLPSAAGFSIPFFRLPARADSGENAEKAPRQAKELPVLALFPMRYRNVRRFRRARRPARPWSGHRTARCVWPRE